VNGCRAVVLAHGADASALWMFQRLRARSPAVHLVLAEELDTAVASWEHHVNDDGVRTHVDLPGARRLTTMPAGAVLNRLTWPSLHLGAAADHADAEYAQNEVRAFAMSWLRSLAPLVVNAPTPQGLCGRWRTPLQWRVLALRAGLPVVPLQLSSTRRTAEDEGASSTLLVIGGELIHAGAPAPVRAAVRRFAVLSETAVLGLRFADGWRLLDATPQPDLRIAGDAGVDATEGLLAS
jgi:hypothetical protein